MGNHACTWCGRYSYTFAACGVFVARLRLTQGDVSGAVAVLDEAEAFVRRHHFAFRMPDVAAAQVLTGL